MKHDLGYEGTSHWGERYPLDGMTINKDQKPKIKGVRLSGAGLGAGN
jgi:hypothetical protein